MSTELAEFFVTHALHFLVGACLVWFLWKAVRMSVRPGDAESQAADGPGGECPSP